VILLEQYITPHFLGFLTFSSASISSTNPLSLLIGSNTVPPDIKRYSIGPLIYILFDFLVSFLFKAFWFSLISVLFVFCSDQMMYFVA
jgi:hypothetical protein